MRFLPSVFPIFHWWEIEKDNDVFHNFLPLPVTPPTLDLACDQIYNPCRKDTLLLIPSSRDETVFLVWIRISFHGSVKGNSARDAKQEDPRKGSGWRVGKETINRRIITNKWRVRFLHLPIPPRSFLLQFVFVWIDMEVTFDWDLFWCNSPSCEDVISKLQNVWNLNQLNGDLLGGRDRELHYLWSFVNHSRSSSLASGLVLWLFHFSPIMWTKWDTHFKAMYRLR